MSGVMWDADGSMDVLELLSQLRAALLHPSDETWKVFEVVELSIYSDLRSSNLERQIVERLRSEILDQIPAKVQRSHDSPAFLTISALETAIQRRTTD